MFAFILFIVGVVAVSLIFFMVSVIAAKNNKTNAEGDVMFHKIYQYLILFVTLMMVLGGSVGVFMGLADLVAPSSYYQTYDEYKQMRTGIALDGKGNPKPADGQQLSDEQLRKDYDLMLSEQRERTERQAVNTMIKSLGWIVVPLPVFIYFKRRLNKEKNA
ncbi:hypothetical protein [Paenibacillus humicola]|uniref:hypothetical protein n=1 Tax=Paenibacillus humicola TaxID=3110540 RepID=UPI00237BBAFF|nr:hypothetical protein [Paenibacillus humicola]